ncbi:MAG TPA: VOC family protein [Actinomycetales bacterium]|nr:VOC family protein [Actinomycetales bacterium]
MNADPAPDVRFPPTFSIVTLGVGDLGRSIAFYRAIGWEQRGDASAGITWFRTTGSWIGLFGYDALAEDVGVAAAPAHELPAYRGITLAVNVRNEDEVDRALAHAVDAGAELVKPATRAEWGGYSGYFADPDGHLWEVAYAPGFTIDDDGRLQMP